LSTVVVNTQNSLSHYVPMIWSQ